MADLSKEEIKALGHAMGLDIPEPQLTEVGNILNALLETMAEVDLPGLDQVEPLSIIVPQKEI